ncbi:acyl-[acyl-carrier-protein]--UDP-N-acetylglucosamine O-acyltransferase [bacterium BMS3Abin07]|nr:acyl-[acyl-carrier-protein]--UDP-N-acetylglucosamine O-acyltransferase [bacterium BMS3Abin07]GBE31825.1 acyl-[acyl-carrier-protein]--UDP-N-acetylglucosamine O-acyltransferase [bacterium BMS3Bbin05]HDZ87910.1 acyl-ACP--UDP-N-acetylglucosamine O-acyltransferase [Nitrospirota bacterium]
MPVHPTAIVDEKADIHETADIGPFCIVKAGVKIGKNVKLQSNVVIEGKTEIGEGTSIFPFACIGMPPQDIKYKGEETGLKIGGNNLIREYVTIHRASVSGDGVTEVGDNCFIMAYSHIAHDCKIGKGVIMANAATLAGHVSVGDYAIIGGIVAVHQFTRIGAYAMVGGMSGIGQDIPPYMIASGARAKLFGLNTVGLKRHGFTDESVSELKKAYRILFREKNTLKNAIKKVQEEVPYTGEIQHLLDFINEKRRGICR